MRGPGAGAAGWPFFSSASFTKERDWMHRTGSKVTGVAARTGYKPRTFTHCTSAAIEMLETRCMLASAAAATDLGDIKHGPLAKVGAFFPLLEEYQNYVAAHDGNGAGFVPRNKSYLVSGDGITIEAFHTRATTSAAL